MRFIMIYITYPDFKTAKKIVQVLMEKRLIACGNFFPIQNTYWWNGKIENSKEVVSIVKTKVKNWNKIKSEIIKLHPYEIPCIIKYDVKSNNDYELWLKGEVK